MTAIKTLIFIMCEWFLTVLSELEFKLGKSGFDGRSQRWRIRYLSLMRVSHGKQIAFGQGVYIRNRGNLHLGERCAIGSFARLWNYDPIAIGDDFLSAGGLTINSATHNPITLEPIGGSIQIGNRVWCGVNVTILAGVTIGDDVVLGAGSVVVSDIPSCCVAAGVPAKRLKDILRNGETAMWKPFKNNYETVE